MLYGATAGRLFAAGQAGERFAVRNSGADVVVEGCGSNGCEYMTGGTAVILGAGRRQFRRRHDAAAWPSSTTPTDVFPRYVNPDSVVWQRIDSLYWEDLLRGLVAQHVAETQSRFAQQLLNDWAIERDRFWQVAPKEMLAKLPQPLSDRVVEERA